MYQVDHLGRLFYVLALGLLGVEAGEYCGKLDDKEFYCEKGHCCGQFECCTYYRYYEMWWFWLLWCIITLLGCSCAYYRRRHMGIYGQLHSYMYTGQARLQPVPTIEEPGVPKYQLPSYDEVIAMPNLGPPDDINGAPPPYVLSGPTMSGVTEGQSSGNNSAETVMPQGQINHANMGLLEEEGSQQHQNLHGQQSVISNGNLPDNS